MQKAPSLMFDWVLNTSLIVNRLFLLLWIQSATWNLPRIILMGLVLSLSISNRNWLFRCNRFMFKICQKPALLTINFFRNLFNMGNQTDLDEVALISFILQIKIKYVHTCLGCFHQWYVYVYISSIHIIHLYVYTYYTYISNRIYIHIQWMQIHGWFVLNYQKYVNYLS